MELSFFGATGETTGSCHLLKAPQGSILLDCGLFQGRRAEAWRRNSQFGFDPRGIAAVVQSHAHIDHSGRLPMLPAAGFRGAVHATPGTRDLCEIMLLDSAQIQVKDAEELNRRRARERTDRRWTSAALTAAASTGEPECLAHGPLPEHEVEPLYVEQDVRRVLRRFVSHPYGESFEVIPGVRGRFHDAGHILGSAWVELDVEEPGGTTKLVFTGDYGRPGQPVLRDPEPLCAADVYISESTYGDRSHPPFQDTEAELGLAVERLARRGRGRLIIPVFAVGRAQNLLYTLSRVFRTREVGQVSVVVDSPLALAATQVVARHTECFDQETLAEFAHFRAGGLFEKRLRFTESVEDSKSVNRDPRPLVVLAASGMLESGRVVHHVAWNVSREDCEILIVGYQARATLGRKLLDGAREVNLLGRRFLVRATITPLFGFSAHADREGLIAALAPHGARARTLFLVHGEDDQRDPLARALRERGFRRVETPDDGRPYSA